MPRRDDQRTGLARNGGSGERASSPAASEPPVRAEIVSQPILGPQPAPAQPPQKRGKPRRPKHVPQRTCVSCRTKDAKRTLVRIVRTPEGTIEVDPTGKRNGRGAYLCQQRSCWDRAVSTPILARALKTPLTPEAIETLRAYAASLPDEAPTDPAATTEKETN